MLTIDILTEEKEFFKGEASFVRLPGEEGELGILPGHAPLLSTLNEGQIMIRNNEGELKIQIRGGFVDIRDDLIQVITPSAEKC